MLKRITASFKADNRYILPDGKKVAGLHHTHEYSVSFGDSPLFNGCPQPLWGAGMRILGVSQARRGERLRTIVEQWGRLAGSAGERLRTIVEQ